MRKDAGLFAAKLLNELVVESTLFETRLAQMEALLPQSYYLAFYRGISYFNKADHEQAVAQFDIALSRDPEPEDLPYILSYKGHSLKDLERFDEAICALQLGCKEDSERPDLYNLLGVCYFKKQNYEQAITCFERAVSLNPASAMDYANIGVNHNRLGNSEEAIRYFTLALTMDPMLDFAREQLNELVHL